MECWQGQGASDGIAIGKIKIYTGSQPIVNRTVVADVQQEQNRFREAREKALEELQEVYRRLAQEVDGQDAEIFLAQSMLLEDQQYQEYVEHKILSEQVNAAYAVTCAGEYFAGFFGQMEDETARARRMDMKDISRRMVAHLTSEEGTQQWQQEPVILVAKELTPSETLVLGRGQVLALVTENGSPYSHAAILARSMNIPALTGVSISPEWEGRAAAVDGTVGILYVEPEQKTLQELEQTREEQRKRASGLQQLKGCETITKAGRKVYLYANIGSEADVAAVLENDGEGIGLLRTEFLYLERQDYPTEEEQFRIYRRIAEQMQGKKVIIRTLDIGGDKQAEYFQLEAEENPALGYRGIRVCLDRKELFKTQLRAILRAAAHGNVAVMLPMIISLEEVRQSKAVLEEAGKELQEQGLEMGEVELGVMIETPAAVMISRELAEEVDFFSIGTNDLTQYTLAVDRQNPGLDNIYDARHPAVLRMIEQVISNAHMVGIPVGICGELAGDESLTEWLIGMGLDEFSVAPQRILELREKILTI